MRAKLKLKVVAGGVGQKKFDHLIFPKGISPARRRIRRGIAMELGGNLERKPFCP